MTSALDDATTPRPRLEPLGDRGLLVVVGDRVDPSTNAAAHALLAHLRAAIDDPTVEWVVGMASVAAIVAMPAALPSLRERVGQAVARFGDAGIAAAPDGTDRFVDLDVAYGGAAGPDLAEVAARAGLSVDEAIALHAAGDYRVACVGFQPGFPYLLGLDPRLATPRRATPRAELAAGTVAIGGAQTGIYPARSPGGWNLIGRTAARLFDPAREPASLLSAGYSVRFRPVKALDDEVAPATETAPAAAGKAAIEVLSAGTHTTIQDQGRRGWRAIGVAGGGAADADALALANALVGNAIDAAGLEVVLRGPRLRLLRNCRVAWLGAAEASVRCAGTEIPRGRPAFVPAGAELDVGALRVGLRLWLALSGGIDVPRVLGSRSTDLRAGFGGRGGRALAVGDRLQLGDPAAGGGEAPEHELAERLLPGGAILGSVPARDTVTELRVLAGAHLDHLDGASRQALAATVWRVGRDSDRMGLRLDGPGLRLSGLGELPSAAVLPGTLQLPPDGRPVVLGVDSQTLGGYPRIAHVLSSDLARLAQLGPGATLRFVLVDAAAGLAANRAAAIAQARRLEGARQWAALHSGR
jgi:KipI family sensor histidine kinase inhibitor